MLAEGKVAGTQSASDTTLLGLRFNKHGALMTGDAVARYYEYAVRGKLWIAKTADSGVAPGTSVGTTAGFSLHNSKGSGVNVVPLAVSIGYVSGTLGAGFIALCTNVNLTEAIPTGTAITSRPGLVGGGAPTGGVALTTSTLANAPNAVWTLWTVGAGLASTATFPALANQYLDGAIVLPPGGSMSLQGVAASGSTPLVVFSCVYVEEPV